MVTTTETISLIAIAYVWSRGSIFRWARTLGTEPEERHELRDWARFWIALADCPLCAGFWIGVIGHWLFSVAPGLMHGLGSAAIVGTGTLALYGLIRRI